MTLFAAIKEGNLQLFNQLLLSGEDIFIKDENGNNIFHAIAKQEACYYTVTMFKSAISHSENARELLKNKNNEGLRPIEIFLNLLNFNELHISELSGWGKDFLPLLIQDQADAAIKLNNMGDTLLHYAVFARELPLVQQLLACGADVNVANHRFLKPIDYTLPELLARFEKSLWENKIVNDFHPEIHLTIRELLMQKGSSLPGVKWPELQEISDLSEKLADLESTMEQQLSDLPAHTRELLLQQFTKIDKMYENRKMHTYYCATGLEVEQIQKDNAHQEVIVSTNKIEKLFTVSLCIDVSSPQELSEGVNVQNLGMACHQLIEDSKEILNKRITEAYKEKRHYEAHSYIEDAAIEAYKSKHPNYHWFVIPSVNGSLVSLYGFESLTEARLTEIQEARNLIDKKHAKLMDCARQYKSSLGDRYLGDFLLRDENGLEELRNTYPTSCVIKWPTDFYHCNIVTTFSKLTEDEQQELKTIQKDATPLLLRNQLGWKLLQQKSKPEAIDNYVQNFQKRTFNVGNDTLELYDLTQADDYRFIVNTVLSKPERLEELIQGEPKFFTQTPFISCCVLDKSTRAFSGGHHNNYLFPLYLAVQVDPERIAYMGPTDIGSPYACLHEIKLSYLKKVVPIRLKMDLLQAAYQQHNAKTADDIQYPSSPSDVSTLLKRDALYKAQNYKAHGSVPFFPITTLMNETCLPTDSKNSYCELIVTGNALNTESQKLTGHLLIVDKYFLDEYNKTFNKYTFDIRESAKASLEILKTIEEKTNGRIKLVLVNTDTQGYKYKLPIKCQIDNLKTKRMENLFSYRDSCVSMFRMKEQTNVEPKPWIEQHYETLKSTFVQLEKQAEGTRQMLSKIESALEKKMRSEENTTNANNNLRS